MRLATLLDLSCAWGPLEEPGRLEPPALPGVPRRVHFVHGLWDDGALPWQARAVIGSWRRHHPDWVLVLWRRSDALRLVREAYPGLLATWERLERPVQRADLLRYLILLHHGGVYVDLDLRCERSIGPLLAPDIGFVGLVEAELTESKAADIGAREPIRAGLPERRLRVANFFLAAVAGHPLLGEMVELVRSRASLAVERDYDVLYTTGPDVVSEVVGAHLGRGDLRLLDPATHRRHVTHLYAGSWRRDTGRRR